MLAAILSGFFLALLAPWLQRTLGRATAWILALLPVAIAVYLSGQIPSVADGGVERVFHGWVPSLGVGLSFYLDGLSLLFSLLIAAIGALILIYAGRYLHGHPHLGRFYSFLLIFMASMLGLVLADNVITLFVFWELTSLSSYLLIGFEHDREPARSAALQALLVTGLGGLALLAGLLLLAHAGGSLEISELLGRGGAVEAHRLYGPILLLILLGAFTKSAQFPFHFWLPSAMEAPTPVSAYLHSATMVKAGIYLLARLTPVLGGTEAWHYAVTSAGAATMLLGAGLAYFETDLKRILAYSTVAALGTLTLLLGLDTVEAVRAAMVFLVVHSLYKGALFLVAGAVDHEAGTRDVDQLGGLAGTMPVTAVAAALAALSMAGLPPMLGFISKELVYEAILQAPRVAGLITGAGVLANIVLVAVAGLAGLRPFFRKRQQTLLAVHEAPLSLWLGPLILAGLGLLAGLAPDRAATFVAPAVAAIRAETTEISLALWHGLNPMLVLSGLTLAGGVGVYLARARVVRATARLGRLAKWGPEGAYELGLDALNALARGQTRILQSGYLRYYLLGIIGTTIGLVTYALWRSGLPASLPWQSRAEFLEVAVVGLILLAALAAVRSGSRLAAVAALGVVGYGVALLYVIFGAPDLAMTQLSIETLTVILLVLVLYHLPRFAAQSSRGARTRDTVVAVAVGGLMATLVWLAGAVQFQPPISPYFADKSVPEAHGRNVVNVILVDFRALDTLGEITVLALAGLGVHALLKGRIEGAQR